MPQTMKAIVKREARHGLAMEDRDVPSPGAGEVLLKVKAASVCGTDVHIFNWDAWAQNNLRPPLTIGHEFAGEVVAAGPGIERARIGDFASVESHIPCLRCDLCRSDRMHICTNQTIFGVHRDGGFAEFVTVPEICLWLHRKPIEPAHAAIMEPLGNAVHAVSEAGVEGARCIVFGCGPAGVFTVMVARALGAASVYAVDIDPGRREMAREAGADETFDGADPRLADRVRELDVAFEMSGAQAALDAALKMLRHGATIVAFGLPGGSLPLKDIILSGRRVLGIVGRHMFKTWILMQKLLDEGRLRPEQAITHRFPLAEFAKAFQSIVDKNVRTGKVVLIP
jgi:threonine 3-dehydrogenase